MMQSALRRKLTCFQFLAAFCHKFYNVRPGKLGRVDAIVAIDPSQNFALKV